MPIFAELLEGLLTSIYKLIAGLVGEKSAISLLAVTTIGSLYVASVVAFSSMISPWLSSVFDSQYGQLLGLLFPPVSGTILASLATYWTLIISYRYASSMTKLTMS